MLKCKITSPQVSWENLPEVIVLSDFSVCLGENTQAVFLWVRVSLSENKVSSAYKYTLRNCDFADLNCYQSFNAKRHIYATVISECLFHLKVQEVKNKKKQKQNKNTHTNKQNKTNTHTKKRHTQNQPNKKPKTKEQNQNQKKKTPNNTQEIHQPKLL